MKVAFGSEHTQHYIILIRERLMSVQRLVGGRPAPCDTLSPACLKPAANVTSSRKL